jgi:hypothetical protein
LYWKILETSRLKLICHMSHVKNVLMVFKVTNV